MVQEVNTALRILRRPQLEAKVALSRSAIYDRLNPKSPSYDPSFPQPIDLGAGKNPPVGWLESEVDAWIASRVQASRQAEPASAPTPITTERADWRARLRAGAAGTGGAK